MQDGTILPADIAIIGIGSFFNTEWLKESSIKMLDNGTLEVDKVRYVKNYFIRKVKMKNSFVWRKYFFFFY